MTAGPQNADEPRMAAVSEPGLLTNFPCTERIEFLSDGFDDPTDDHRVIRVSHPRNDIWDQI